MTVSCKRLYHSPIREAQASATRKRIIAAARALFLKKGYDGATIEEVAHDAGVAPQTVYAAFHSKPGLLREIVREAAFGPAYQELVQLAHETSDPCARLRFTARIARQVYDAACAELELLCGACVISPELASLAKEAEQQRYVRQRETIAYLQRAGCLRSGLSIERARDILWVLTGRDLYRMFVVERKWSADQYQHWLEQMLEVALLAPRYWSAARKGALGREADGSNPAARAAARKR